MQTVIIKEDEVRNEVNSTKIKAMLTAAYPNLGKKLLLDEDDEEQDGIDLDELDEVGPAPAEEVAGIFESLSHLGFLVQDIT